MEGHVPGRRVHNRPPAPYHVRDGSQLRISDEDRHKVAEVLRQAAGEGRIDLDELEERLEAAYKAKTYGDLVPITADLPLPGAPHPTGRPAAPTGPTSRYGSSVAVMSETKRTGAWLVEDGHTAFAFMGSVLLDLREAQFAAGEITVNANAVMGEVKLIVDAGTTVVVDGYALMGEYCEQRAKVPFDSSYGGPVVRVRGMALMASVHVQRRGAPGERRRWLGSAGT